MIFLINYILSKYSTIENNKMIKDNKFFYNIIIYQNLFAISIYTIYIIKNYINYNSDNNISITLSFVYIKYLLSTFLNNDMTLSQYESSRNIMWFFATPLMLKMYCDVNKLNIRNLKIHYHLIPTLINIFIYSYKNTLVFNYFIKISWILYILFMKNLHSKQGYTFTNIYIYIWYIFMFLNILDVFELLDIYTINIYYSYADLISKIITNIIVNDYNEKQITQTNKMDLQSVQFTSYMIENIKKYKNDNAVITLQCDNYISLTTQNFLIKIPESKVALEQELLKKILPFNYGKNYIDTIANTNANANANANTNKNTKQFNMICVLFTDIVNYTELAKKYDDKIIFDMLSCTYTSFDNVIKKYPHLQKIETIGDAYMVVGDIFRHIINHQIVIKEIILFALDIITEIKKIKTPDSIPLCIRIGINMGNISVGILGTEIPRLCVVGNTVNMASRLQSTADIDTIQFSKDIYDELENIEFNQKFEIIKKENVFLKNIGSITSYNICPNISYDNNIVRSRKNSVLSNIWKDNNIVRSRKNSVLSNIWKDNNIVRSIKNNIYNSI